MGGRRAPAGGPWVAPTPGGGGATRLFCFPHGGAGALAYAGWEDVAPPGLSVVPVRLPGREHRWREPSFDDLVALADAAADGVEPHTGSPFALFGHSFGALVAYEVARRLAGRGRRPLVLAVSAYPPPDGRRPGGDHHLPDAELLAQVGELGGLPGDDAPPEWVGALRADCRAVATYRHRPDPLLDVPVVAIGGDADPVATPADLAGWSRATSAPTAVHVVPGGHFYLRSAPRRVLEIVGAACR